MLLATQKTALRPGAARRSAPVLASAKHAPPPPPPGKKEQTIKVCTAKACKKQGSPQVLKFMQDLHAPSLNVTNCGCLGGCGSGPNIGVSVAGGTRVINHVATPSDAVEVLDRVCGVHVATHVVKATHLRLAANQLANDGNLPAAISKYSEALKLGCTGQFQSVLYANRSAAHLSGGNKEAALSDAQNAVKEEPKFGKAWTRLIDALYALGRYAEASDAFAKACAQSEGPSFQELPEFRDIEKALESTRAKQPAHA